MMNSNENIDKKETLSGQTDASQLDETLGAKVGATAATATDTPAPAATSSPHQKYKLTKKDFAQINRRTVFGFQVGWNYERMCGTGYLYSILPQLRKIYGDGTPELKKAMKTHAQFYNTNPYLTTVVSGIDMALEEEEGVDSLETVTGLKTGLMGSLAAIGDSIFVSLVPAILGALAANMATQGNPVGIIIWIAVSILFLMFRLSLIRPAYKQGTKLVTDLKDKMNILTDASMVLGVFMVGALIATTVNVSVGLHPEIAGVAVSFQNILDMIAPKLVPAALVFAVYKMLGLKKITSTKAIFIVIIVSVLCSVLGILVK